VSLMQALRSEEALALARGKARSALEDFGELMARLAPLADQEAAIAIDQVLDEIDYDAWMAEMDDPSGVDREANVDELRAHAEEFDRKSSAFAVDPDVAAQAPDASRADDAAQAGDSPLPGSAPVPPTLRGFLQEIALVSDTDNLEDGREKVTMMTLHSAKGLEFPVVFIAGVEEELLPHARAVMDVPASEVDGGIEEERRLFYVGLTRAKERLILTHARERLHFGQQSWRTPSRFLEEIPRDLVEGFEPDRDEDEMLGPFAPPSESAAIAVGDRVEHDHFGRGVVERLQGSGVNARATVQFAAHGTKLLLLQYAKLKVIGRGAK